MSQGQCHTHGEAYMLMWYRCACGHAERIWNSRDGVTPFGTLCASCGGTAYHKNWSSDEYAPDHKLRRGQRYWRDGTSDEAEKIMRNRITRSQSNCPVDDEYAAVLIAAARSGEGEFRQGWPVLATYGSEKK